jgi:ribokinase
LFRREGLDATHVRVVSGVASGVALIFVDDGGENMIGVASGANARITALDVHRLPADLFRPGDVLLTGLEIPPAAALAGLVRGRESGMITILNPAPALHGDDSAVAALLAEADVITPNGLEARALLGASAQSGPDWDDAARRLLARGPGGVVITLGAEGCLVAEGETITRIAARRVAAVDTVGAGDAFNGALAAALAEGRSLAAAAAWAAAAAALAVTQPGAQSALPLPDAIDAFTLTPDDRPRADDHDIRTCCYLAPRKRPRDGR